MGVTCRADRGRRCRRAAWNERFEFIHLVHSREPKDLLLLFEREELCETLGLPPLSLQRSRLLSFPLLPLFLQLSSLSLPLPLRLAAPRLLRV